MSEASAEETPDAGEGDRAETFGELRMRRELHYLDPGCVTSSPSRRDVLAAQVREVELYGSPGATLPGTAAPGTRNDWLAGRMVALMGASE